MPPVPFRHPDVDPDAIFTIVPLLAQSLKEAAEDRREQTKVLRSLGEKIDRVGDKIETHNKDAVIRNQDLLLALKVRDAGTETAIKDLSQKKSVLYRWSEDIVKELWSIFKTPLAAMITLVMGAAGAWYVWAHYQIPPTPTPIQVQEVPKP